MQLEFRKQAPQPLDMLRQEVADNGIGGGDCQRALDGAADDVQMRRLVHFLQDLVGVGEELSPRHRQVHAARRAQEQVGADDALQFLDGGGHSGLGDREIDRRLRYLAKFRGCDEIAKLAKADRQSSSPI
ncbi:hypothetical protein D9M69_689830 [compost metagenome]